MLEDIYISKRELIAAEIAYNITRAMQMGSSGVGVQPTETGAKIDIDADIETRASNPSYLARRTIIFAEIFKDA